MPDVISDYRKYGRGWTGGLPETQCGYGSKLSQTRIQRHVIPAWFKLHGIASVADIGAGDLNWIRKTDLGDVRYTAYDLVPRHDLVQPFNLLTCPMPDAECYMVLWVLNHFPEREAKWAIKRLLNNAADWLLMTWEPRMPDFLDLPPIESVVIRDRGKGDPRGNVELRLIRC